MLTEVKAYSSWRSAPTLPLLDGGRAETDPIQIRNIDGLDPVKAAVNTSPLGSVDGTSYVGSSIPSRNLVLTLHPNPDWELWTHESLRKLIYQYFMPKRPTRLVFYSDDMGPVEISGVVESVGVNIFSKDPEYLVSIICPDPYFTALEPTVITGNTIRYGEDPIIVDYKGTIESGIKVKITAVSGPNPEDVTIQIGDPKITLFGVAAGVDSSKYFELSSIPMQKFVQNIGIDTGVITNLLSKVYVQEGALWPTLQPGDNEVMITTDVGVQDYELSFYERFGGL